MRTFQKYYAFFVFLVLTVFPPFLSPELSSVHAQVGNSVSGYVFGFQRQPLEGMEVQLLDDLSRMIKRTRTNGAGFYIFSGIGQGRFKVRVMSSGRDYEEQEQEIEIRNFLRDGGGGSTRVSGFGNEQKDFQMRLRKGSATEVTGAIFVQEIPVEAKKLYEKGLSQLKDKKEIEAFESIKAALEIFPKYYYALETLGNEYIRLKYFEAAEILLNIAVDVNPRGFKSLYGLAYSRYSLNKTSQAVETIQKAITLNPNSADTLLFGGIIMKKAKRFEESEKMLVKAKETAKVPTPEIHWQLALLYGNNLKRYADAANELKLFLKAQPDSQNAEEIKKLIREFEKKAGQN